MIRARSAVLFVHSSILANVSVFCVIAVAGAAFGDDAKKPRTDLYGDPLPPGAVMRLGSHRLRHSRSSGISIVFSSDGKHLISCGYYEVCVRDAATGRLTRRTRLAWRANQDDWISHLSLTPDGATAAAWGSDGLTRCLYDTAAGQQRGRLTSASVLAFSPDGKKMAVQSWDKKMPGPVHLWDIDEFKKSLSLDIPPRRSLGSAVFTPDGKRLAALSEHGMELFVWDALTGQLKQRKKFSSSMASLAYAPDGAILAVGRGGRDEVVLFDAATLKEKAMLPARTDNTDNACILRLVFSPDGRRLAALRGEHVAVGYAECGLVIWDLHESAKPRRLFSRSDDISDGSGEFAFTPDGKKLAYCDHASDVIDLWDVDSGRRLRLPPGHDTVVKTLAVSANGKVLASSDYRPTLRLWDTVTGKPLRSLPGGDKYVSACLFSADGQRMLSESRGWKFGEGKFQVWEAATGKELLHFGIDPPGTNAPPWYVETVALSGDGKRLVAVAWAHTPFTVQADILPVLFVWDAATGKALTRRPLTMRTYGHGNAVQKMSFNWSAKLAPDGESFTEWRGDRLVLEDISTKSLLAALPKDVGDPRVFSADGRLLAAMSFQPKKEPLGQDDVKGLSLIETASGQEVVRLEIGKFDYVAFTPDGRTVVAADKERLSVWDAATGERLHQMTWPDGVRDGRGEAQISSLAVLPDGRAATGTTAGDILVWDLAPSTWPVRRPQRDSLDALWSDLARDAHTAYRAVSLLSATQARSVALLGARLHPVAVDRKRIEKLIADLEDERYKVREAASHELTRMSYHAEPILRRALQGKPALETRRRIELILGEPRFPSLEDLRTLRAIAVLERIGTPEARRILDKLAAGAASPETRQAKSALQRLNRR